MHIWVIYESKLGNTAYLAKAIANALSTSNRVQLVEAETASVPYGVDLVFIGYPSHRGKTPDALLSWLAHLSPKILTNVWIAPFEIRYRHCRYLHRDSAFGRIAKLMQNLGGKMVCRLQRFYLLGKGGPFSDAEINRGIRWALLLEQRLGRASSIDSLTSTDRVRDVLTY